MTHQSDLATQLKNAPHMVRWFSPKVLLNTAKPAVFSAVFGQYADRRLIQAALDSIADDQCASRYTQEKLQLDKEDAIWVDYVADLGDGFEPTYAIAYLLAQPAINLEGLGALPRGQLLIMGGDQVYPTATRENYETRFKAPYRAAFPNSDAPNAEHPAVFLIPGNHDWYDGLVLFLANFCRGRETKLGSWRSAQHRSYFAIPLPNDWWIWGCDTQLTQDVDTPQANYFANVARSMQKNAKIILCAGVPSWLKAEETGKEEHYRGLDYVASIARDESPTCKIFAVLSGDKHHYSRYSAEDSGTQFIVSGGGGAFLHPTHQLKDSIRIRWAKKWQGLSLKRQPANGHGAQDKPACYPSRECSRWLLLRNLWFVAKNLEFCLTVGFLYWIAQLLLSIWTSEEIGELTEKAAASGLQAFRDLSGSAFETISGSPMFVVVATLFGAIFVLYANGKNWVERLAMGIPHAILHLVAVLALMSFLPVAVSAYFEESFNAWWSFIFAAIEFVIFGGVIGGTVWGLYLGFVCALSGRHYNDAFSAMRLDRYKHFLRMKIQGDKLTIFPVGLDSPPSREHWTVNPNAAPDRANEPGYLPDSPLQLRLIEGPIIIQLSEIKH